MQNITEKPLKKEICTFDSYSIGQNSELPQGVLLADNHQEEQDDDIFTAPLKSLIKMKIK